MCIKFTINIVFSIEKKISDNLARAREYFKQDLLMKVILIDKYLSYLSRISLEIRVYIKTRDKTVLFLPLFNIL